MGISRKKLKLNKIQSYTNRENLLKTKTPQNLPKPALKNFNILASAFEQTADQRLEKILNFGEKIETIRNFNQLVDFIVEQASSILESERCSLMLLDEHKGELCIKGAVGLEHDIIKKSKVSIGEDIAGLVVREGKPILVKVIDDDQQHQKDYFPTYKTRSLLSVPIKFDQKIIGVLNVTDKKSRDNSVYTKIDLKILLTIVRQVSIALENAQLSKELKYLTIVDP